MNANQELEPQILGNLWALRPRQMAEILDGYEKEMSAYEDQHESVLREVQKRFVLPSDRSVASFLDQHRNLSQILLEAAEPLKACFGGDAIFSLSAPVDEFGSQTLYASAMWPGSVASARAALDKFDDTWWIPNSLPAFGNLTFTYKLV